MPTPTLKPQKSALRGLWRQTRSGITHPWWCNLFGSQTGDLEGRRKGEKEGGRERGMEKLSTVLWAGAFLLWDKQSFFLFEILGLHLIGRFYLCKFYCHSKCSRHVWHPLVWRYNAPPPLTSLFCLSGSQLCFCLHAHSAGVFWLNQQTPSHDSTAYDLICRVHTVQ